MDCRRKLVCKSYVIFVGLLILLVASMLGWIANARLEAYHQYHIDIGHESLSGVDKQVAFYIAEKRRMVKLFVRDHIEKIRTLAVNPDNDDLKENLGRKLTEYFPDRFAFSVADINGTPRYEDFDGLISELCLSDVKQFSKSESAYRPYIHPNTEGYHFDIMVHYGKDGKEGIFFVSILADVLGNIVNSIQSPDHQIMLILPEREDLIEVVAEGARNKRVRDDYRLSDNERALISMRHDIEGTRWQVVDSHSTGLHARYRGKLIAESLLIFLVFITIAILLVVRLRKEERQRELAEEQKQALMSVVSHEFRSPVSIIKSALDLVIDGDAGKISADVKKYICMASRSTSRLMLLVNDFLDVQNIESGSLSLDKQECQLSSVVSEAVSQNKIYAEQFSACYELKMPLANDYVSCDSNRIEQVLTNLLTNAAKYGADKDTIEVAVIRKGKQLRVSISDHGPGIPKEFQSRVFDKFSMAHVPNNDKKVKSSGLGLSIAKAIIEQHGGIIGFDVRSNSKNETGATFWFELPVL